MRHATMTQPVATQQQDSNILPVVVAETTREQKQKFKELFCGNSNHFIIEWVHKFAVNQYGFTGDTYKLNINNDTKTLQTYDIQPNSYNRDYVDTPFGNAKKKVTFHTGKFVYVPVWLLDMALSTKPVKRGYSIVSVTSGNVMYPIVSISPDGTDIVIHSMLAYYYNLFTIPTAYARTTLMERLGSVIQDSIRGNNRDTQQNIQELTFEIMKAQKSLVKPNQVAELTKKMVDDVTEAVKRIPSLHTATIDRNGKIRLFFTSLEVTNIKEYTTDGTPLFGQDDEEENDSDRWDDLDLQNFSNRQEADAYMQSTGDFSEYEIQEYLSNNFGENND